MTIFGLLSAARAGQIPHRMAADAATAVTRDRAELNTFSLYFISFWGCFLGGVRVRNCLFAERRLASSRRLTCAQSAETRRRIGAVSVRVAILVAESRGNEPIHSNQAKWDAIPNRGGYTLSRWSPSFSSPETHRRSIGSWVLPRFGCQCTLGINKNSTRR